MPSCHEELTGFSIRSQTTRRQKIDLQHYKVSFQLFASPMRSHRPRCRTSAQAVATLAARTCRDPTLGLLRRILDDQQGSKGDVFLISSRERNVGSCEATSFLKTAPSKYVPCPGNVGSTKSSQGVVQSLSLTVIVKWLQASLKRGRVSAISCCASGLCSSSKYIPKTLSFCPLSNVCHFWNPVWPGHESGRASRARGAVAAIEYSVPVCLELREPNVSLWSSKLASGGEEHSV